MRRVLVTRPAHDAPAWVQALQVRGIDAQALPLMAIGPCTATASQQALQAARVAAAIPGHYRALMFVSGNAVRYFFAPQSPATALPAFDSGTRAWAPGPGTDQALQRIGVAPAHIDAPLEQAEQFESESLWSQVSGQIRPGDRVLIVRGNSPSQHPGVPAAPPSTRGVGRDWLAARLREAGAQVQLLAVYERRPPIWSPAEQAQALAAAAGALWLFSSSEAVANLQQMLPQQSWAQAQALATHPRIAHAALQAGFGRVLQCRPALADVVSSIESTA